MFLDTHMCCAAFPSCTDRFFVREELDFCAAAAPCDSLRLRSGSQEATGWVAAAENTQRFWISAMVRHAKQMILAAFVWPYLTFQIPKKCKHADILSHVIVELGSEISFATLKKIKIPFSLKSKIGVFQPQWFILNHSSVLLVRWTEDICVYEAISPALIKTHQNVKNKTKLWLKIVH